MPAIHIIFDVPAFFLMLFNLRFSFQVAFELIKYYQFRSVEYNKIIYE